MSSWDERFEAGDYPDDPDPSPVLQRYMDSLPDGRALDLATGTGRNAVFLATEGYEVDAIDKSRPGLETARENARKRGVADRVDWIQADLEDYTYPAGRYDVITISFYRAIDQFTEIKGALQPGGVLFVEHHLRSTEDVDVGPSGNRYRFAANELLHACLDLTILYFDAVTEDREDGRTAATTRILARYSTGPAQAYPQPDWD